MSSNDVSARIAGARAELEQTLDAIEEKFNIPQRFDELTTRAKESFERNPVPWIVGAIAGAVVVASVVAWAILSDDD